MEGFEIVCDATDDRQKWLEARRTGIGSSDAPGVLGLPGVANWTSPIKVYTDKLMPDLEDVDSEPAKWGRILEPHIIAEFSRDLGRKAEPDQKLIRSRRWPFMLATCDATQTADDKPDAGTLEVKATGWRAGDWSDGIPDHVQVQAQHQLAVRDWEWGSVAVLLRGVQLQYCDIQRDEALIERIVEANRELWERFQRGEPPNPDGSESAREALKVLYPKDTGEVITLSGEFSAIDDERSELAEKIKELQKRKEFLDQQIKGALGDATVGVCPNGVTYTHRLQQRKEHIVKASEFRVLRRKAA